MITLYRVSADVFAENRDAARKALGLHGLALHPTTAQELVEREASCYLTLDGYELGGAGFAVTADGELLNLFNVTGQKLGDLLVGWATFLGAHKLDVYEGPVADLYRRHGFHEVGRDKWADEYAPAGWDYEHQGRPDVVYLALPDVFRPALDVISRFRGAAVIRGISQGII